MPVPTLMLHSSSSVWSSQRHDCAVEQRGHDQAAGGGQRAGCVRIGHLLALLDLAGRGIENDEAAGGAGIVGELAAVKPSAHMGGLVTGHRRAGLELRDVEKLGLSAVGRRPEIVAARHARAEAARRAGHDFRDRIGIGLQILVGIVVERLAGFRIDPFGPRHLRYIWRGLEELAADAIEGVGEAVACGPGHDLAILAVPWVSMRMWLPLSSKSIVSFGVYWWYQRILPVAASMASALLV